MRITAIIILLFFTSCVKSQTGILGVNVSDGLPLNPSLLTWTKVHEERYLQTMDENHVHYTSDFASSTSNLSAVSGSSPSISGGNLVLTGSVKYKSTSNPVASWTTTELTIASMGSAGDSNKLGAMLIKDATHYIAMVYDKVRNLVQLIQNDVVTFSQSTTLNTTGLKIFLVISGSSPSFWYQESGGNLTASFAGTSSVDFKAIDISEYKYGVYCLQSGGTTTHNVSSLRGAASGTVGLFNDRMVGDTDGSNYIVDGKLLMTADATAITTLTTFAYTEANSVLLGIDTATWAVEILGRFYFDRTSKRLGGQDLHIVWNGSQWLCHYVPVDNAIGFESNDVYFYLDYADIFTEVVIQEADLTEITFNGGGTIYDVNTRLIGGVYKSAVTRIFSGEGRAWLYSGTDLDDMDVVSSYDDGDFYELGSWVRYRGTWYLMYSSFGDTKEIVLSYPDMDFVGYMDLPFVDDARIPGYDWYCKQTNGKTTYYMIGFDTDEYLNFPWALGKLVVWKATEQKNGYEF